MMLEIYYGVLRMSGNQKTVVLPSNHSSSFTSPIYARKDPSSPTKFLPLNLSSRPLETLGRSLTTMPHFGKYIGLQFTDHSSCAGSKPSTITWSGTELLLFLLENVISTSSTSSSWVRRLRKGSTYICRRKCSTSISANAIQGPSKQHQ